MYIPSFNRIDDRSLLIEGMRSWSFAVLFGIDTEKTPQATHLPLTVADEGEHGVLEGHFARANPHWQTLAGREALVVFSGPHSYVSPSLYASVQSVPTWNYIAIHACGVLQLVEDAPGKEALLRTLIAAHEPAFLQQWQSQTPQYRAAMLHNIVGFRIPIARIEGKFKLSQNRPDEDRKRVAAAHAAGTPDEQSMAAWMRRLDPEFWNPA